MSLLPHKTQLEQDLDLIDHLLLDGAEALNHAAAIITNANRQFWNLPTERLLAALNSDVPRTLAIFEANTATGNAINTQLEQFGNRFPHRAPVVQGRSDITFDITTSQFVLTSPEE